MPFSPVALDALRAAVRWNPVGARELLAILREYPEVVKHKDNDLYGPIGLILWGVPPRKIIGGGVTVPLRQEPFPDDRLAGCRVFGAEWKRRQFTPDELANALETLLAELR